MFYCKPVEQVKNVEHILLSLSLSFCTTKSSLGIVIRTADFCGKVTVNFAGDLRMCVDRHKYGSTTEKISISSWMLVTGAVYSDFVITAVITEWQHLPGKCVCENLGFSSQLWEVFGRPYYRSNLWYSVSSVVCLSSIVCLSSVTFCIVAKRCVLAKKCLKE